MYISGMKMGYIVENFLRERNQYNPTNYQRAYAECKNRVHKIKNGEGKATRYQYFDGEILPVLMDLQCELEDCEG